MARKLNPQPPATYTLPRYFELLDSYQRSLAAGNLSKRTIETYSHSARDFGFFLTGPFYPEMVIDLQRICYI
jgi:hypothetical protein